MADKISKNSSISKRQLTILNKRLQKEVRQLKYRLKLGEEKLKQIQDKRNNTIKNKPLKELKSKLDYHLKKKLAVKANNDYLERRENAFYRRKTAENLSKYFYLINFPEYPSECIRVYEDTEFEPDRIKTDVHIRFFHLYRFEDIASILLKLYKNQTRIFMLDIHIV